MLGIFGWSFPFLLVFYDVFNRIIRVESKQETQKSKGGADDKGTTISNLMMVVVIDILVFFGFFFPSSWFARDQNETNQLEAIIAVILMIFGFILRASAMNELGSFFSKTLVVQESQKVIQSGLYSIVRHPGYAANMFVWLPPCFVLLRIWLFLIVLGAVAFVWHRRISIEEEMMVKHLGSEYNSYKQRVPFRMIPFLY